MSRRVLGERDNGFRQLPDCRAGLGPDIENAAQGLNTPQHAGAARRKIAAPVTCRNPCHPAYPAEMRLSGVRWGGGIASMPPQRIPRAASRVSDSGPSQGEAKGGRRQGRLPLEAKPSKKPWTAPAVWGM